MSVNTRVTKSNQEQLSLKNYRLSSLTFAYLWSRKDRRTGMKGCFEKERQFTAVAASLVDDYRNSSSSCPHVR